MPAENPYKEVEFVQNLTSRLTENKNLRVDKTPKDRRADIVVEDTHTGKKIYLEIKNAGQYGELPISSIISVNDQVKHIPSTDQFMLITLSSISSFLSRKLKEINVVAISNASVDEVVNKVQLALSA